MRISSVAIALLLATGAAQAEDVTADVPGHPGVTYEMLLRAAMPGLKKNADGSWESGSLRRFRELDGSPAQTEDKPPQPLEISFGSVDTLVVRENGHRRLLLLTQDNTGGTGFDTVLAAFDDETNVPKFLDYVDAGRDRFNGIGEVAALGAGTDLFVATSSHSNSSQSYEMATPLFLRGGKFRSLDTFFIYGAAMCSYSMLEDRSFTVKPKPSGYGDIVVRVVIDVKPGDSDCSGEEKRLKPGHRVVNDTYRWDAKKNSFVATTGAVSRLSDRNWKDAEQ